MSLATYTDSNFNVGVSFVVVKILPKNVSLLIYYCSRYFCLKQKKLKIYLKYPYSPLSEVRGAHS